DGSEETLVVARGGWVRLPEELLVRAGITDRVRAELAGERIVVSSAGSKAPGVAAPEPIPLSAQSGDRRVVAEVRGARKSYGRGAQERLVLEGLDATFVAGTLVAVTGPSG